MTRIKYIWNDRSFNIKEIYEEIWVLLIDGFEMTRCKMSFKFIISQVLSLWVKNPKLTHHYVWLNLYQPIILQIP